MTLGGIIIHNSCHQGCAAEQQTPTTEVELLKHQLDIYAFTISWYMIRDKLEMFHCM